MPRLPLVALVLLTGTARGQAMSSSEVAETTARAEARSKAKDWAEASVLWEKLARGNPVQGQYWDEMAQAAYQARDYRRAIAGYEQALALGWGNPSSAAYNAACSAALAGDKPAALRWLERAFALGFRSIDDARADTDLVSLHAEPRFRALVPMVDRSTLSRTEGWRYDLSLVSREVKRTGYSPFKALPEKEFDRRLAVLKSAVPRLTDTELTIELMKIFRLLGDGHTGVLPPTKEPGPGPALPLQFYFFEEGLYVIAADPRLRDLVGARVLRFGDRSVAEVTAALDPLIWRDNDLWPKQIGPYWMRYLSLLHGLKLIPSERSVQLTVQDAEGRQRSVVVEGEGSRQDIWNQKPTPEGWVTVSELSASPLPLSLKNARSNYWFDYLPGRKAVYFQFNTVRNEEQEPLASFSKRLARFVAEHDVERLVIDLRLNNGGNTYLVMPLLHDLIAMSKVNERGRLFVLIGRRTFSAAQNTASMLERHTNAIFVGEPTGSSPNFVGEERFFTLPYSGLRANVSNLFWQSSWPQDRRTWIAPQVYVPPTFEAYRSNRDTALEAALSYPGP